MLEIDGNTRSDAPEAPAESDAALHHGRGWTRQRRLTTVVAVGYVLTRVLTVLASPAFETPDTASYTSGQATRPPLGSFLLARSAPPATS